MFRVKANALLGLAAGDGVNVDTGNTGYVKPALDGTPTRGTDVFVGVSESSVNNVSNTAALDGLQSVQLCGPGSCIQGKAQAATDINTDAKLLLLLNGVCNFKRSAATAAGTLTFNTGSVTANKSSTLSFVIISGDIQKGTVRTYLAAGGIIGGSNI